MVSVPDLLNDVNGVHVWLLHELILVVAVQMEPRCCGCHPGWPS